MENNLYDRMKDSYHKIHLEDTELKRKDGSVVISPKLKLILGWSVFVLCCLIAYVFVLNPGRKQKGTVEKPEEVIEQDVDVKEEHDTMVPYEKDAYSDLNEFIQEYYTSITSCNYKALQKMVTDSSVYKNDESLKKKAEFITGYSDITVYTKPSLEEGNYVAYVVSNVTISGVNSSLYDIQKYYIVNGERGYMINNGTLSEELNDYIAKVTGDADIQKIYQSVKEKNEKLEAKDPTIKEQFYDILKKGEETTKEVTTEAPLETEAVEETTP